jgi:chromosome segregation ATPase
MTSTRYFICLVAQAFGFRRKNIRTGDAAGETHLLKEAETHLGKAIWENVEDIEALSVEYWNLRKLIKERDRCAAELETLQTRLAEAHEERAGLLTVSSEPYQELLEERQGILIQLEELARERDQIVVKAREIRRSYDGMKTKEEVLTKEGNHTPEEFAKITARLAQLKAEFAALKAERHGVADKISQGDAKIDEIDAEIQRRKKERREKASEAFQHIGDANQEISTRRAELGVLDTRMRQLYGEIGRHVSRNAATDPGCRKACKEHQGLVDVMGALRKSILLNHRLAENG